MSVLEIILTVLFIIVCLALAVIILLQEGKQSGLGAISGVADTYWGKNKGRSMEGKLEKGTKILVIAFFIFAILLNVNSIVNPSKESATNNTNNAVTQQSGTVNEDSSNETNEDKSAEDTTKEAAE